jgi:hypothetical protein
MFLAEAMGVPVKTKNEELCGPKAGYGGVASSFFCFDRDPHGLYSLPFQKAKVLVIIFHGD